MPGPMSAPNGIASVVAQRNPNGRMITGKTAAKRSNGKAQAPTKRRMWGARDESDYNAKHKRAVRNYG